MDKRSEKHEARAYRLELLAKQLRNSTDYPASVFPEDDWVNTVNYRGLVITCEPTDWKDHLQPWRFRIVACAEAGRPATDVIEMDADVRTNTGIVERGGNIPTTADAVVRMASQPRSASPATSS